MHFVVDTGWKTVGINPDRMMIINTGDGTPRVTATRQDDVWTVHAEGQPDATATTRADAITAMTAVLSACLGTQAQVMTPTTLVDQP